MFMINHLSVRKTIRLRDYDYSKEGFYFITICTKNRIEILGKINDLNNITLSQEGIIVEKYIHTIDEIFKNVIIDEYIIMPNHIHMIIKIKNKSEITISRIIKQYKMAVSKKIGYSVWQKSFYEHIIRSENEYYKIKEYIQNNILNWEKDIYY